MIQDSSGLSLDLDIIYYILPTESGGLLLDYSRVDLVRTDLGINWSGRSSRSRLLLGLGLSAGLRFGIITRARLERLGNLTTGEDQDFAL